ncbi:MAG: hypothetical protein IJT71_00455 [Oscillospiraceae bacterium]|nr:hypothetical protein [Oscillospiraceae bacterium]
MAEQKRRWGDRRDATLLRDADAMHFIMGVVYPSRPDNEAYISERIDLTPIKEYLAQKNGEGPDFKYTMFHVILTALLKTITLRPKLNRFYKNENYYQRHEITAGFTMKKSFDDHAEEALAFIHGKGDATVDSVHDEIRDQVTGYRGGKHDATGDAMELFRRLPRFLSKFIVHFLMWMDKHGWVPKSLIENDANYASVFLTNLGSIKLKCGYHHLSTWGTTSLFVVIGEKKWSPVYDENGFVRMTETLDLGLTVDERIADGYYFSRSVRLLKYLLEHPRELEKPLQEEIDYE